MYWESLIRTSRECQHDSIFFHPAFLLLRFQGLTRGPAGILSKLTRKQLATNAIFAEVFNRLLRNLPEGEVGKMVHLVLEHEPTIAVVKFVSHLGLFHSAKRNILTPFQLWSAPNTSSKNPAKTVLKMLQTRSKKK